MNAHDLPMTSAASDTPAAEDGGELLLQAFCDLGIDYIISSPGSEWPPLWEALARQRRDGLPGPTYVDCGHETLAVGIAAGIAQVTGRMQAVLLHAGPGLSQGAMAIGSARDLEVPMLVMSGESATYGENGFDPGAQWYRNLSVVGGQQRLIEPLVKWAQLVPSHETLYGCVVRAGEMAQRTPKGPVYLSVSMDAMLQKCVAPTKRQRARETPRLRPAQADIDAIAQLLARARSPLIAVQNPGGDVAAYHALLDLAEALCIPVTEAPGGYFSNFPKSHELYLGVGRQPQEADCDLLLVVENATPWYPPSNFPQGLPIVAIAANVLKPHLVYQRLGATHYLEGDVASTLQLLADGARGHGVAQPILEARLQRSRKLHDEWVGKQAEVRKRAREVATITVPLLIETLQRLLPADAAYVDETIVHRPHIRENLHWDTPQVYFRSPTGLGQGVAYALGVKQAAPHRPVVMLIGDGTFMYNPVVPALAYADEHRLPLLVVILNNLKYAVMQELHDRFFPAGTAKKEDDYYGVHLHDTHYERTAAIVDGFGCRIDRPEQLEPAIRQALDALTRGKSAILNVYMPDAVAFK